MASRDLTQSFVDRRNAAIRKRSKGGGGGTCDGFGGNWFHRQNAARTAHVLSIDHHCDRRPHCLWPFAIIRTGPSSDYKKLTAGGTGVGVGVGADTTEHHDLMLIEEGNANGIQMSTLNASPTLDASTGASSPPPWVQHVDAVERSLQTIRAQMQDLRALHSQRVGSVFGKDLENMEGRIERMTAGITDEFRVAERHLQTVGRQAAASNTTDEATVGANVQRSLAKRLQELSVNFRQSQRKYLAEVQAQKTGKVPEPYLGLLDGGTDGGIGGQGMGAGMGGDGGGEFFTTQQMAVVDDLTQAVQSRDSEIIQIAKSIEELSSIFKELAVLVIDQGTILDRIDYNMEAVVEHTKTGIQQLEKAERSQKSARPMRCIICLSVLIFVLLVLLVLKWR